MNNVPPSLAAALAAPKTHKVLTLYECGKVRDHQTRNLASAENYAIGERRKIGRALIDRESGKEVRVCSVTIENI